MRILGIDPGLTGALAIYAPAQRAGRNSHDLDILDMPTLTIGTIDYIDVLKAHRWLCERPTISHAYLENVNAMPAMIKGRPIKIGASSAFKFGARVEAMRVLITLMEIPLTRVVPRVWKKTFGLEGSEGACEKIGLLLPEFKHLFMRKMDHGRADAGLIAIYGARMQRGE